MLIFSPSESIASNLFADIFLVAFASFCQVGKKIFYTEVEIKNARQYLVDKIKSEKIVSLILGGPNKYYSFNSDQIINIFNQIKSIFVSNGYKVIIIPSMRTPKEIIDLAEREMSSCGYVVNKVDKQAYLSSLALSKYIVVTCDSSSMISEAALTGKPIYVGMLPSLKNDYRFKKFRDLFKFAKELKLRNKQCDAIANFYDSINKFHDLLEKLDCKELFRVILEEFNIEYYYKNNPVEQDRYNNLQELKSSIDHFAETSGGGLREFLQEIALYTDLDDWNNKQNSITLMTVHAAKGLEFPTVFITGLEQGLFPLMRIDDSSDQFQEERRLFYVALTRAMEKAYLLNAHYRRRFGSQNTSSFIQSDFLNEIDKDSLKLKKYKSVYTKRIVSSSNGKKVKVARTVTEFDDFAVGDMVQHNLFGVGTIIVLNGAGENQKVGIEFKDGLKKKLIVKYANLKRID